VHAFKMWKDFIGSMWLVDFIVDTWTSCQRFWRKLKYLILYKIIVIQVELYAELINHKNPIQNHSQQHVPDLQFQAVACQEIDYSQGWLPWCYWSLLSWVLQLLIPPADNAHQPIINYKIQKLLKWTKTAFWHN
jgi:hypothetical protein